MIKKDFDKNGVTVQLSVGEILIINNALNEICNAFGFSEFEMRIGATVEETLVLLKSVGKLLDSSGGVHASDNMGD